MAKIERQKTCAWTESDECWTTTCGHTFQFTVDGPRENGAVYCMYCGGKISSKSAVKDRE